MIPERQFKLPRGVLKFIPLLDGKLIIAQKVEGTIKPVEILTALRKMGISYGILSDSIPLIQRDDITEIPVACAYFEEEPPEFNLVVQPGLSDKLVPQVLQGEPIELLKDRLHVSPGEPVLKARKSFRVVLRFPDGRIEEYQDIHHRYNLQVFSGANVAIRDDQIVAQIDGSAFVSKWGKVYVFPILTVRGLGEIHGKVDDQFAVHVLEDIHSYSNLEIPSNLFVTGMIHSSFIKALGYVQAQEGIDNSKKIENSRIIAGKSVITPHVKRYRIIAGEDVWINESIQQSIIISHRKVVARLIDESEIRVRSCLYADEVRNGSQIYLGPSFLRDEGYKRRLVANQNDERKLNEQEYVIENLRDKGEKEKRTLINYFSRLKESGRDKIVIDSTMERVFKSLQETHDNLQKQVKEYEARLQTFLNNKILLAYYVRENRARHRPFIRVYGKIEKGVTIVTANQNTKLSQSLDNVTIYADPFTGKMEVVNHKPSSESVDFFQTI